jgi:hypothetical protein
MKDFKVVQAQSLLKIYSFSPIRGFLPLSIVVIGEHMDLANQVFYNDVEATEFVAQSPRRLIVRIPQSQVGQAYRTLRIYSSVNLVTQSATLNLRLSNPLASVEGLDRLVQDWMIVFYTTPGSDIFDPLSGGGGRSIIGRNTDRYGKGVSADLALAIDRTQQELLRLQSQTPSIPLAEKLLNTQLLALSFDASNTTLSARIGITNMLGNTAEASVT